MGGVSRGGYPIWTCPSFFVFFCPFGDFLNSSGIFPICSGMVRGFFRFVPFLFLGLLRALARNSPERVRDTIWTFPEKSGKPPSLEPPPGLAYLNFSKEIEESDFASKLANAITPIPFEQTFKQTERNSGGN